MRGMLLFFLLALHPAMNAQIVLQRQLVGACAVNGTSESIMLSSTTGEAAAGASTSENIQLNAGFQQNDQVLTSFELLVEYNACWNGSNASLIVSAEGCGELVELIVLDDQGLEFPSDALPGGFYTVYLSFEGGCSLESELAVPVPQIVPCDLLIHNFITPNHDGKNDQWIIGNIEQEAYQNNRVTIVNRWGQSVWEAINYDNETVVWDGRNDMGELLPEGTYFYEISIGDLHFTGYLTLLP